MKNNAEEKPVIAGVFPPDDSTDHLNSMAVQSVVIPDECGDTMWDLVLAENWAGLISDSEK